MKNFKNQAKDLVLIQMDEVEKRAEMVQEEILRVAEDEHSYAVSEETKLKERLTKPALKTQSEKELKEKYSKTTRTIMQVFTYNKGKGITREGISGYSDCPTQIDDILDVLVQNGYLKYVCYSTVCHYLYVGKK